MSGTMQDAEIIVKLKDVDQLLIGTPNLFDGKRMLTPDAEDFLNEVRLKFTG